VLRSIRSGDEGEFVPSLAVFFGFVLALGGVGVLIFFIHHIASSIQASSITSTIIASVAQETIAAIDRLFPDRLKNEPDEEAEPAPLPMAERIWHAVLAKKSGYIQSVDHDSLLHLARERRAIVRMACGVGEFVVQNTALVSLALEDPLDQGMIDAINASYSIGRHRTVEQDPAFGIRELVDVAMKTLSPGLNDATTAVVCVDYLGAILAQLATRQFPPLHSHEGGELRQITIARSFENLLAESFDPIRRSTEGNVTIMTRMLGTLQTIASLTTCQHRRRALREQVRWIGELVDRSIESAHDRARIATQLTEVCEALDAEPSLCSGKNQE
jgi:uncharacterized membrane protein